MKTFVQKFNFQGQKRQVEMPTDPPKRWGFLVKLVQGLYQIDHEIDFKYVVTSSYYFFLSSGC